MKRVATVSLLGLLLLTLVAAPVAACPFCSAVQMTFYEEVEASDLAVFATLIEPPLAADNLDTLDPVAAAQAAQAKFRISEVIKGEDAIAIDQEIQALYFGDLPVGSEFIIMGVEPDDPQWSTPIHVTPRIKAYVEKSLSMPPGDVSRLLFAIDYLEDENETLRRDSYDEFAKMPYDVVKQLRGQIDHDRLIGWIKDPETPASRRRLYFTLLGVNGSEADLPMLEEMIISGDDESKTGLDSLIACYLQLGGPEKLSLVDEHFLANPDAEYTHIYAALMALRFHGQETDVIPRERLVKSFRLMLDRPKLADLVIPDLARWEDWEAMPQLVELFKEADQSTSWVRVPVVNYLRACPLPEAQEHLEELAKIDPDAVRRASTFFPFSSGKTADNETADDGKIAPTEEPADPAPAPDAEATPTTSANASSEKTPADEESHVLGGPIHVSPKEPTPPATVPTAWLIATPVAAAFVLLAAYALILRTPRGSRRSRDAAAQ